MFKYPQFASRKKKERNGRQYFDIGIKIKTIHFTKSFNDSLYSTFHGDKTNLEQFIYLCLIYKGHVIKYLWTTLYIIPNSL